MISQQRQRVETLPCDAKFEETSVSDPNSSSTASGLVIGSGL